MSEKKYFPGLPVTEYLEEASSGRPVPGGGSVASVAAALGASLMEMVANFTVGKEKYISVEEEVKSILSETSLLRRELVKLAQEDTEAYGSLSSAFKMPRQTDDEKKLRAKAVQDALKNACAVPLRIAQICVRLLALCPGLARAGNANLITDVGVAVNLIPAAFESALLNVEINLKSIKDADFITETRKKISVWKKEIDENRITANGLVNEKL
ncbi:cyclodeaminase/cyclohydrolase family protein [bacterium]|nr:cyclodeaminase/cyclohydrolase family protein [Candidatus Omnitrophota bacterium]MBU2528423.1 cyclodeaminase/cyclohydrolase family protein [bacterium]MBU3930788.1 cyclodeaminase/cyclohydrolase family protein [bacterium]MBU4123466.1 cyclodeaminase/cyclohydrolase family protein [bacterium]